MIYVCVCGFRDWYSVTDLCECLWFHRLSDSKSMWIFVVSETELLANQFCVCLVSETV